MSEIGIDPRTGDGAGQRPLDLTTTVNDLALMVRYLLKPHRHNADDHVKALDLSRRIQKEEFNSVWAVEALLGPHEEITEPLDIDFNPTLKRARTQSEIAKANDLVLKARSHLRMEFPEPITTASAEYSKFLDEFMRVCNDYDLTPNGIARLYRSHVRGNLANVFHEQTKQPNTCPLDVIRMLRTKFHCTTPHKSMTRNAANWTLDPFSAILPQLNNLLGMYMGSSIPRDVDDVNTEIKMRARSVLPVFLQDTLTAKDHHYKLNHRQAMPLHRYAKLMEMLIKRYRDSVKPPKAKTSAKVEQISATRKGADTTPDFLEVSEIAEDLFDDDELHLFDEPFPTSNKGKGATPKTLKSSNKNSPSDVEARLKRMEQSVVSNITEAFNKAQSAREQSSKPNPAPKSQGRDSREHKTKGETRDREPNQTRRKEQEKTFDLLNQISARIQSLEEKGNRGRGRTRVDEVKPSPFVKRMNHVSGEHNPQYDAPYVMTPPQPQVPAIPGPMTNVAQHGPVTSARPLFHPVVARHDAQHFALPPVHPQAQWMYDNGYQSTTALIPPDGTPILPDTSEYVRACRSNKLIGLRTTCPRDTAAPTRPSDYFERHDDGTFTPKYDLPPVSPEMNTFEYRQSGRPRISSKVFSAFRNRCGICGLPHPNDPMLCPYADGTMAWNLCPTCRRGFHKGCRLNPHWLQAQGQGNSRVPTNVPQYATKN